MAGGVAGGVAYWDAMRRADEDSKNAEAVAEAGRLREAKAAGGKADGAFSSSRASRTLIRSSSTRIWLSTNGIFFRKYLCSGRVVAFAQK